MQSTNLRVGISGGTFDPIHYGHLIIAEQVREAMALDVIIFIPAGTPPHKVESGVTVPEKRYEMVNSAISSNPYFKISDMEIERQGYTYTVDTLKQLRNVYGNDAELFFIIGADVVAEFHTWKDYENIFGLCNFVAVMRPGFDKENIIKDIQNLEERFKARIDMVDAPLIDISSTYVRERVAQGKTIRYLVPQCVERYIEKQGLYIGKGS